MQDPTAPVAERSIDPTDYQTVPRPVAVMAKTFPEGFVIARHSHSRDQFLYAVEGVMRIRTERDAWIVPPDRAVYIPGGAEHEVTVRGRVEMRTLFISPRAVPGLPENATVQEVSQLLRALVLALLEEPVDYDEDGRGGFLARLILSEIARAKRLSLVIPMPRDTRLARLCEALLSDPRREETLQGWADHAGASERTLSRLFQAETGLTFTAWRQRVRFHNAMEALARGEPVGMVARSNGYSSSSAFAAAFRKVLGVSPSGIIGQAPRS